MKKERKKESDLLGQCESHSEDRIPLILPEMQPQLAVTESVLLDATEPCDAIHDAHNSTPGVQAPTQDAK